MFHTLFTHRLCVIPSNNRVCGSTKLFFPLLQYKNAWPDNYNKQTNLFMLSLLLLLLLNVFIEKSAAIEAIKLAQLKSVCSMDSQLEMVYGG